MTNLTEGYNHVTPIAVRFHDLDALGHVNNARYLNYLEEGRLHYARDVCGWNGTMETLSLIVARVEIEFKAPVRLQDTLNLHTRVTRLGNKSFDADYVFVVNPPEGTPKIAATAQTVMVAYDYVKGETVRVWDSWREAITAHESMLG